MATTTDPSPSTSNADVVDIGTLIVSTPGTLGGRPRLAGTRISIRNIVGWHQYNGWTPEEIIEHYSHLTLDKVYAGLAFYYANKEKLDAEFAAEEEEERRIVEEHSTRETPVPSVTGE